MEHLEIYNALCNPPKEALRTIQAGRLKGKTDINPMWRIKALTERFGPCGLGWKYEITRQWLEAGPTGEVSTFCNILLYYRQDGEWSAGIPGTGGSAFVANEKSGPYQSDECYKMALTDALSVAAKAIGAAGNVYWAEDPGKYRGSQENGQNRRPRGPVCRKCGKPIKGVKKQDGTQIPAEEIEKISKKTYGTSLCLDCQRKAKKAREAGENGGRE